jgi:hypothetical protein
MLHLGWHPAGTALSQACQCRAFRHVHESRPDGYPPVMQHAGRGVRTRILAEDAPLKQAFSLDRFKDASEGYLGGRSRQVIAGLAASLTVKKPGTNQLLHDLGDKGLRQPCRDCDPTD